MLGDQMPVNEADQIAVAEFECQPQSRNSNANRRRGNGMPPAAIFECQPQQWNANGSSGTPTAVAGNGHRNCGRSIGIVAHVLLRQSRVMRQSRVSVHSALFGAGVLLARTNIAAGR